MPSTALETFIYTDKQVRVIGKDPDDPWFVLADVCDVLGIKNATDTAKRLDPSEQKRELVDTGVRGEMNMIVVNELGLYEVVLTSRSEAADPFKQWVKETLRQLRTRGFKVTDVMDMRLALSAVALERAKIKILRGLDTGKPSTAREGLDEMWVALTTSVFKMASPGAVRRATELLNDNPFYLTTGPAPGDEDLI
jgi:prophage antirepressor-like protein